MTRWAVTGATGFLGKALLRQLLVQDLSGDRATQSSPADALLGLCRRMPATPLPGVRYIALPDFGSAAHAAQSAAFVEVLQGVHVVVHTAALVHVAANTLLDPLQAFRQVNVLGTLALARQAARSGVQRFVFISSVGVNGAETFGVPFRADGIPAPHSPYAVSKHEAELGLRAVASETGMEVVIVRPPMVYGPDAPGSFGQLVRWLERGMPLPLGAVHNLRSFVGLDNLVDLIIACGKHPAAANQTLMVSDGEDVSTTMLLRRTAAAMDVPARLVPVPAGALRVMANVVGKATLAQSLLGSLQVDVAATCSLLGWAPPVPVDEGLRRAVQKGF